MSLYISLVTVAAIGAFLRYRYGFYVTRYTAATLLLVLFLFCPTSFWPGIGGVGSEDPPTTPTQIDQLGEIVGFGLLIIAAWIAEGIDSRKPG